MTPRPVGCTTRGPVGRTTRGPVRREMLLLALLSAQRVACGCIATCTGSTCDEWLLYGYSCSNSEDSYGCDCSGCSCDADGGGCVYDWSAYGAASCDVAWTTYGIKQLRDPGGQLQLGLQWLQLRCRRILVTVATDAVGIPKIDAPAGTPIVTAGTPAPTSSLRRRRGRQPCGTRERACGRRA